MGWSSNYKPVGGVESVALYPTDAVTTALFSSDGCEVELSGTPIEVALLDDASLYEECSVIRHGATLVTHRLQLVAERSNAEQWLDNDFIEHASLEGFIAVISLCKGCKMLAGYSVEFGNEQSLRLESLTSSSGTTLHDTPSVTLRLISHDTEFSAKIL